MGLKIFFAIVVGIFLLIGVALAASSQIVSEDYAESLAGFILPDAIEPQEEYVKLLIKTSDNIHNNDPKISWSAQDYAEERAGSGKQGYVVNVYPNDYEFGNLEKDPAAFMIITIPASEWNESWLEPEYDYDNPIYDINTSWVDDCMADKDAKNNSFEYCEENAPQIVFEYPILTERKWRFPLANVLTTEEHDAVKNIGYNEKVNWTIEKELTDMDQKVEYNNWTTRPDDMKLHGSSGNFTICPSGCNYTDLATWETAQDSDLRGTGPAIAIINATNFTDTTTVTISGWSTNESDNIRIVVPEEYRHSGVWNDSLWHFNTTDTDSIGIYEDHVVLEGIQARLNTPTSSGRRVVYIGLTASGNNITISYSILRGGNDDARQSSSIWINDGSTVLNVYNSLLYNGGTDTFSYGISGSASRVNVYSTTIANTWVGIRGGLEYYTLNVLCTNSTDSPGQCFYCGLGDFENLNFTASDDGSVSDCQNNNWNSRENQNFSFMDKTGAITGQNDFHLNANDTGALGFGYNLSVFFPDDIDRETRDENWDIGMDEFVAPTPEDASPTVTLSFPEDNAVYNVSQNVTYEVNGTDDHSLLNVTFFVWNSTFDLQFTNTTYWNGTANSTQFYVNLTVQDLYQWGATVVDNSTAVQDIISSNRTVNITAFVPDETNPDVNLTYPLNITYTLIQTTLNYTASDANLSTCFYSTDLGVTNTTIACGTNVTGLNSGQGSSTWIINANDTTGNQNSSSVTFFVDSIFPDINMTHPENMTYNAIRTEINYTVNDTNLQSCWYSTDLGVTNTTITCADNVTGLNSGQGSSTWKVYSNDTLGNENSSTITFFVDSIYPEINITFPENTTYANALDHMNYTYNDTNVDTCLWSTDLGETNTTIACGTNVTGITSVAGSNTWEMYINDTANNINISSVTFVVTSNPPVATIVSPVNNTNTSNTALSINFTISDDDLDTCWYSNDTFSINTTITCGNNITSITWSEGIHNVTVYGNDSDGNEDSDNVIFTIDTTAPIVSVDYPTIGANFGEPQVPINISITELYLEDCWWSNNSGATNTTFVCANNITGLSWNDGNNQIFVWANDSSGNIGVGEAIFTIDNVPPDVTINSPENITYTTTTIVFDVFPDDPLDIDSCLYSLNTGEDNITMTQISQNFTDTNSTMTQGSHTAEFYCNDSANNINTSESITFVIDSTSPVVTIAFPTNQQNFSTVQVDVNFSVTGTNIQTCWWTNNSGADNNTIDCNTNLTAQTWNETLNTVNISANNTLGTQGSATVTFRVDTTAPVLTLVNHSVTVNTTFSQILVATDSGVGVGTFSLNNTDIFNISNVGEILNVTALTNVSFHWLQVVVNDTLNNSVTDIFTINITETPVGDREIASWGDINETEPSINFTMRGNAWFAGNISALNLTVTGDVCIEGGVCLSRGGGRWGVDNLSLINVSGTLAVNETWMNTTIDDRISISQQVFTPHNVTVHVGTIDAGDIDSIITISDGDSLNISEVAGTPGFELIINFTNVTDSFTNIQLHHFYDGSAGHTVDVELWDYNAGTYDDFGDLTEGMEEFDIENFAVANSDDYISNENVSLRIRHSSAGNVNHDFFLDYVALQRVTQPTRDHGSLTGLQDDDHAIYLDLIATRNITGNLEFDDGVNVSLGIGTDLIIGNNTGNGIFEVQNGSMRFVVEGGQFALNITTANTPVGFFTDANYRAILMDNDAGLTIDFGAGQDFVKFLESSNNMGIDINTSINAAPMGRFASDLFDIVFGDQQTFGDDTLAMQITELANGDFVQILNGTSHGLLVDTSGNGGLAARFREGTSDILMGDSNEIYFGEGKGAFALIVDGGNSYFGGDINVSGSLNVTEDVCITGGTCLSTASGGGGSPFVTGANTIYNLTANLSINTETTLVELSVNGTIGVEKNISTINGSVLVVIE